MKKTLASLLVLSAVVISCSDEGSGSKDLTFNLKGAKALLYSQQGISSGRSKAAESNLFKIEANGDVTPVLEGSEVVSVNAISWGMIVTTRATGTDDLRTFYVKPDNTSGELPADIGRFIGENDNGDVVFVTSTVLRKSTLTLEPIQTTLTRPLVDTMSGNFVIISDRSIHQILNTVDGVRYNVMSCNGPHVMALDATHAVIDDCQPKTVIDMATGERTEGDVLALNHEGVRSENGAVVLAQGLGSDFNLFYLGEVDVHGGLTLVNEYGFQPGSPCMSCSSNSVLHKTGDYFIVRELSKVTVVKRGEPNPVFILSGYNVTSISTSENRVYYLAEDSTGHPITGVYDLVTQENKVLQDSGRFTEIHAMN
ncbi:hypothetical protein [Cystobacter fuscus]|uniref:hypothetical protein n=1 Tax=Cystobacter fuscus TaxID=43 RepID=UPI0012DBE9B2|nr:hypothetical protein [Cystobacter fuscus]